MAKEKISIKFLIHLVGERPAIWDKTSQCYKDRALKETSWREICSFVNENFEQMSPDEQMEFTKMVCKKWTYIRDAWAKSMRFGYNEETKLPPKPYVYHNELKFLQKILVYRRQRYDFTMPETTEYNLCQNHTMTDDQANPIDDRDSENYREIENNNDNGGEENEDVWRPVVAEVTTNRSSSMDIERERVKELPDQDVRPQYQTQEKRIKFKYNPSPTVTKKVISHSRNCCDNENFHHNRHWNFFKSILPSLNNLDDDHTLQFQAGVITLLQKLKSDQNKKSSITSKKRRSLSSCSDEDSDYEWPEHKVKMLTRSKANKKFKQLTDPIANEGNDNNSGTENVEYA